jgi:hypothetical protein
VRLFDVATKKMMPNKTFSTEKKKRITRHETTDVLIAVERDFLVGTLSSA